MVTKLTFNEYGGISKCVYPASRTVKAWIMVINELVSLSLLSMVGVATVKHLPQSTIVTN